MKSKKLFQKQKRHNAAVPLFVFLLLSPYILGFTEADSSYVETLIAIGGGQYVYHDCSGAHKQKFSDVGVYAGKKYSAPFRLGISAGGMAFEDKGFGAFLYPDLALDWKYFSIGTTGIRLGSQNDFYLESKWLDQPPYFSGKGLARFGIGGKLEKPFSRFWIGTNTIPYSNLGIATQLEFPWEENIYLFVNGRFGKDKFSNYSEYGLSVGMRMVSF